MKSVVSYLAEKQSEFKSACFFPPVIEHIRRKLEDEENTQQK